MMNAPSNNGIDSGNRGVVRLVGAGPGAPGWLTTAGLEACRDADVIFYDRLAIPVLEGLNLDEQIELVDVGKVPAPLTVSQDNQLTRCKSAHRGVGQDAINDALLKEALAGRNVTRLKGGDPLIFGRGGEEAAHLRAAGVRVEIIPGVSAFQAAAMALEVSLTHRGVSSALQLITGHRLKTDDGRARRYWIAQADSLREGVTLAFYMGMGSHERMVETLLSSGCPGWMPAAVVANASMPTQRVLRSRLANLTSNIARGEIEAPAIILIGKVLLQSWELAPSAEANEEPLIIGHEASVYFDGADLEIAREKSAGMLLVCEALLNSSIFRSGIAPEKIDRIRLSGLESVLALRESLEAAEIPVRELNDTMIDAPDAETIRAVGELLGLEAVHSASSSIVPNGALEIWLHGAPAPRVFPATSYVPHPDNMQRLRELLTASPIRPLAICDANTAAFALPFLMGGETPRPLYARDAETRDILRARGLDAQIAYKLKSLYPGEHILCPAK